MLRISVVVVNWNSKDDLGRCLDSIRLQRFSPLETIVVDNGSSDGSVDMIEDEYPEVRLVKTGENLGFAEGMNRGIEAARGDWIASLNNDAVADPGWLEALAGAVSAGPSELGMLQSRMVFLGDPGRLNSTGVEISVGGGFRDRQFHALVASDSGSCEVFCPCAGAALYRRGMLEEIRLPTGYFDRSFFMYYEDVDLGWRARLAGWCCRYVAESVVHHAFHGSSSRREGDFVSNHLKTNRLRCLLKNGSAEFLVLAAPRVAWEAALLLRAKGWQGARELARAARDGATARSTVTAVARVERRSVERSWASFPWRRS